MTPIESETSSARTTSAEAIYWLNVLALYAVCGVLIAAYVVEFTREEFPCPLCLLQRIALTGMAAGLVMNLRFGLRPRHYGLILLAAAAGGVFAVRQILLHIAPGDPGYGSTVLGYHYYTWCAIVFAIAIVATAIVLLFDEQFEGSAPAPLPTAGDRRGGSCSRLGARPTWSPRSWNAVSTSARTIR